MLKVENKSEEEITKIGRKIGEAFCSAVKAVCRKMMRRNLDNKK